MIHITGLHNEMKDNPFLVLNNPKNPAIQSFQSKVSVTLLFQKGLFHPSY